MKRFCILLAALIPFGFTLTTPAMSFAGEHYCRPKPVKDDGSVAKHVIWLQEYFNGLTKPEDLDAADNKLMKLIDKDIKVTRFDRPGRAFTTADSYKWMTKDDLGSWEKWHMGVPQVLSIRVNHKKLAKATRVCVRAKYDFTYTPKKVKGSVTVKIQANWIFKKEGGKLLLLESNHG